MLSSFKPLTLVLLLSTIVHGACVDAPKDSNDVEIPVNFEVQEPGNVDIAATTKGIDISASQPTVNWGNVVNSGVAFVYIHATQGMTYVSPYFQSQWHGATTAGLIRGAYHIARPDQSTGSVQAIYFIAHGGAWTKDGKTLPGAVKLLDLPGGGRPCYGMESTAIIKWITDFSTAYHAKAGRYPVIFTGPDWWNRCTHQSRAFSATNPLWFVHWGTTIGPIPGWSTWTFWQYGNAITGGLDYFNGNLAALEIFAL